MATPMINVLRRVRWSGERDPYKTQDFPRIQDKDYPVSLTYIKDLMADRGYQEGTAAHRRRVGRIMDLNATDRRPLDGAPPISAYGRGFFMAHR